MAAPTFDQFKLAVARLYGGGDAAAQKEASDWMTSFSVSQAAWQVTDGALWTVGLCPEDQLLAFAAANVLLEKVRNDFDQIPPASRFGFRDSVLRLVKKFVPAPSAPLHPAFNRLCIVVAALAVQMGEWTDVVGDVVRLVGSDAASIASTFQIIALLPEEANSGYVNVAPPTLATFQETLKRTAPQVLTFLSAQFATATNVLAAVKLFECFCMWTRMCSIPVEFMVTCPLLARCFEALPMPPLFEACTNCVVELLMQYHSPEQHQALLHQLIPRVMGLVPLFKSAAATGDEDTSKGLCRIFTEMAENCIPLILGELEMNQVQLVEVMLLCTQHPEVSVCAITLPFWDRLQDAYKAMGDTEVRVRRQTMLSPSLAALVPLVVRATQYPDDFASLQRDKQEEFRKAFRFELADVLLTVCAVLGVGKTLELLGGLLQSTLPPFAAAAAAGPVSARVWRPLEACLFCIRSMGKVVPTSEATVIPATLRLVLSLPPIPELRLTGFRILGRYAEWMANDAALANASFELLFTEALAKYDPFLSDVASETLRYLAIFCAPPIAARVIDVFPRLDISPLARASVVNLMEAMGYFVSSLPADRVCAALVTVTTPDLTSLTHVVTGIQAGTLAAAGCVDVVESALSKIGFAVSALPHGHEAIPVFVQQIMPIIDRVARDCCTVERVIDQVCNLHKFWVRNAAAPAVCVLCAPLITHLQSLADAVFHPCLLYGLKELLTVASSEPACCPALMAAVVHFTQLATRTLVTAARPLDDVPDLVIDLYALTRSALRYLPELFVTSPILPSLVGLALQALSMQHREAVAGVRRFWMLLMDTCRLPCGGPVHALLQSCAPHLFVALIANVSGGPSSHIDDPDGSVAKVMFDFAQLAPELFQAVLEKAIDGITPALAREVAEDEFRLLVHFASTGEFAPFTQELVFLRRACRQKR